MEIVTLTLSIISFVFVIYMFASTYFWSGKIVAASKWESASEERLTSWRLRNQGVYIGLSSEGTALVLDRINSYRNWVKVLELTSPVHDEFIEFLKDLLNEFPDPSPNDMPNQKEPHTKRLFLFVPEVGLASSYGRDYPFCSDPRILLSPKW